MGKNRKRQILDLLEEYFRLTYMEEERDYIDKVLKRFLKIGKWKIEDFFEVLNQIDLDIKEIKNFNRELNIFQCETKNKGVVSIQFLDNTDVAKFIVFNTNVWKTFILNRKMNSHDKINATLVQKIIVKEEYSLYWNKESGHNKRSVEFRSLGSNYVLTIDTYGERINLECNANETRLEEYLLSFDKDVNFIKICDNLYEMLPSISDKDSSFRIELKKNSKYEGILAIKGGDVIEYAITDGPSFLHMTPEKWSYNTNYLKVEFRDGEYNIITSSKDMLQTEYFNEIEKIACRYWKETVNKY